MIEIGATFDIIFLWSVFHGDFLISLFQSRMSTKIHPKVSKRFHPNIVHENSTKMSTSRPKNLHEKSPESVHENITMRTDLLN